jgi:hypothetical protein
MEKTGRVVGTTARIYKLLDALRDGELFSSQDLLECGSRDGIDKAVHRAVRAGRIQRIEPGVFCRTYNGRTYKFDRIDVFLYKERTRVKKRG